MSVVYLCVLELCVIRCHPFQVRKSWLANRSCFAVLFNLDAISSMKTLIAPQLTQVSQLA